MRHVKLILIIASILVLYLNCTIVDNNWFSISTQQETITIHKFWELDTIKLIKPGLYGMDSTLVLLDFRDEKRVRFKGPENTLSRLVNYTIIDSLIIILDEKRRPVKGKKKNNNSGPGVLKITDLTNDTMIVTAGVDMGGKKIVKIVDLYELHYKVRRN